MSDTTASLLHKLHSARQLKSVVRTTKTLAAASIGQYERALRSLVDYCDTVELGLSVCFRHCEAPTPTRNAQGDSGPQQISAVVFGSDQGLVGRFNEVVADHALATLATLGGRPKVWAVGERVEGYLEDAGMPPRGRFKVPSSVQGITTLVSEILIATESENDGSENHEVILFYNHPKSKTVYAPACQKLLPLDALWQRRTTARIWPTKKLPETVGSRPTTLRGLIHEYLFVLLFRAAAESLTSENACRLAAMQRAEKNIEELVEDLTLTFHRLRQSAIDEELFDLISGFEALRGTP